MKNLFLSAFFVATTFAIEDYNYRPTECEVSKCVSGWCKYEGCTESISCPGGLCYFS
jgi:hypothetical protein